MAAELRPDKRDSFNPRPHAEGDVVFVGNKERTDRFQSTPSRGGRLNILSYAMHAEWVSIHALTRRATGERNLP